MTFPRFIFYNKQNKSCSCGCHSTLIKPRWFLKKKSTSTNINDNEKLTEFKEIYELALEQTFYAIESKGSIYYNGDFIEATEAYKLCLDKFNYLLNTLSSKKSFEFQDEWSKRIFYLKSSFSDLT